MRYLDYSERNNYRTKPYHRLDLNVAFIKQMKRGEQRFVLGVINAYSRKNPFFVNVADKYQYDLTIHYRLVEYSLFPFLPSVSYSFKF
jgi:hypothetical protein